MTRFYRLRSGKLTWSCQGETDIRDELTGIIGLPSVEPDGQDWRLILPIACDDFVGKISIRLDEPEFQTLEFALREVRPDDLVTIFGSGLTSVVKELPYGAVANEKPGWEYLLNLADCIAARMRLALTEKRRAA
jgi:hypothetical protein